MLALQDILPAGQAFREGSLDLPATAPSVAEVAAPWIGNEVNSAILALAAVLLLSVMRDLKDLAPAISGCAIRWRGNLDIEHSVHLSRERNWAAMTASLFFCIIANRFAVYDPGFIRGLPAGWRLPATAGAFIGYLLVRWLAHRPFHPRKMDSEARKATYSCFFNYMLLLSATLLPTAAVLLITGASVPVSKVIIIAECSIFFILALVRKWQILKSNCSFFVSFLYLCALEILPAAMMVTSAVAL
ncbi:MAG: DUF4271 domain-containing protein [Bacteroidales bacterium]|nr:DUF4271 domain-containing protein [Bacteroidales bacterium]